MLQHTSQFCRVENEINIETSLNSSSAAHLDILCLREVREMLIYTYFRFPLISMLCMRVRLNVFSSSFQATIRKIFSTAQPGTLNLIYAESTFTSDTQVTFLSTNKFVQKLMNIYSFPEISLKTRRDSNSDDKNRWGDPPLVIVAEMTSGKPFRNHRYLVIVEAIFFILNNTKSIPWDPPLWPPLSIFAKKWWKRTL